MRILLVNPPNPDPPPAYFGPPYGLSLLGAILRRDGHEVRGQDHDRATVAEMTRAVLADLADGGCGLLGVSCQSSNRGAVASLVRAVKAAHPGQAVVVGGPFATVEPELILRRSGADWAAIGDGERTLPELVAALVSGRDPRTVDGLSWLEAAGWRAAPPRAPFSALDELPYPDFELFDAARELRRYRRPRAEALAGPVSAAGRRCLAMHSALMVLSSRGCVYRCVFCPMSTFEGAPRLHSPAYFVDMVAWMSRRYECDDFVFGDNYFTRDRERVLAICAGLRRVAPGIRWICMTRADAMDAELAAEMASAGCREVSFGVESGSPRVQRATGKRLRLESVPKALTATRDAGMQAVLMLMVGNPGDDMGTTRETADFLRRLEPDRVLVQTTKVYPGTRMHATAQSAGVIPSGYYEGDEHRPPLYTVERSASEIERMRALLPTRTHYLEGGGGCVDGCCSLRRPEIVETGGLARALAGASLRAERCVIGGGDALLLKDLERALDDARELQVHDLALYTTGRALVDAGLAARLRRWRDLRRVIIPRHSPQSLRHDARARVPGALARSVIGVKNWTAAGGKARAWLVPDAGSLDGVGDWIRRLAAEGFDEALLCHREPPPGWGALSLADAPSYAAFARAAGTAAQAARGCGLRLGVFGLPPCLWDSDDSPRYELEGLYDESMGRDGVAVSCRIRRAPRFAHGTRCKGCALRASCDGIWKDYLAVRGEGELDAR